VSELSDAILELRAVVLLRLLAKEGIYPAVEQARIAVKTKSDVDALESLRSLRARSAWWSSIFRPREREIIRHLEDPYVRPRDASTKN
jgi:hypothetical protein